MVDRRVNILFLEDGTMRVSCPYNKDFIEALGYNAVPRTWNKLHRAFYFPGKHAGDVLKLLDDFFSTPHTQ